MNKETLRMQMLAGVITEGQYKEKLQEIETKEKDSLNEHAIGGIVGIGAINQIPSRAKTDYEDAFEHFLGERYEVKPNRERDDIKDINETELEEIGVGAVLGGAAIAALAKKTYGAYKNYALKKGMKETGEEKKGSNGVIAKEYMSEKDGKTYWGITYQDDTRDSGYEKPRMFLFTPEKIDKVLNTDLKFATSDEDMMADGADQKLGQFIADKVVMLEGEEESYNY